MSGIDDPIRNFLKSRGLPRSIVADGFEPLLEAWERLAQSISKGESQYYDDYLNDLDTRRILEDLILHLPKSDLPNPWIERLKRADELYERGTDQVPGFSFRIPKNRTLGWPE